MTEINWKELKPAFVSTHDSKECFLSFLCTSELNWRYVEASRFPLFAGVKQNGLLKLSQSSTDFNSDLDYQVGAKPYLLIAGDQWKNSEWLTQLIKVTATALPVAAHKKGVKTKLTPAKKPDR